MKIRRPDGVVVELPEMSEAEFQEAAALTDAEWAKVALPSGWTEIRAPFPGMRAAISEKSSVIFSAGRFDGQLWLHVSIAGFYELPTYLDLVETKEHFIGRNRQALQVFPTQRDHVNIHARALHLWCSLEPEGDRLPAFGRHGTI